MSNPFNLLPKELPDLAARVVRAVEKGADALVRIAEAQEALLLAQQGGAVAAVTHEQLADLRARLGAPVAAFPVQEPCNCDGCA